MWMTRKLDCRGGAFFIRYLSCGLKNKYPYRSPVPAIGTRATCRREKEQIVSSRRGGAEAYALKRGWSGYFR
jgi:hypothetical protein